eukprot:PhM_4_TR11322/c1_g1_i2/m.51705
MIYKIAAAKRVDWAVHARIESDAYTVMGARAATNRVWLFKTMLQRHYAQVVRKRRSKSSCLYVTYGQLSHIRFEAKDNVPLCNKKTFVSSSDVLEHLTATTFYDFRSGRECTMAVPQAPQCATLTNTSGALVDFAVLMSAPNAILSAFSSFGDMLFFLRCSLSLNSTMYGTSFSRRYPTCPEHALLPFGERRKTLPRHVMELHNGWPIPFGKTATTTQQN